jgi:hypothetical protein
MPMTIRDTDLPQPITKAWQIALRKKHYEVIETPPEPRLLTFEDYSTAGYLPEGPPPTLEQYVAAGYHAEGYQAFVDAYVKAHAGSPMPED